MAEVLGVAASIIAVLQLTTAVSKQAYRYGLAVKNAKEDIQEIEHKLKELEVVLGKLTALADQVEKSQESLNKWPSLMSLRLKNGPLAICEVSLLDLRAELTPKEGFANRLERARWPLKKKKAERVLDKLEKQREAFLVLLNIEHVLEYPRMQVGITTDTR
jgi:hypothetical protein